MLLNCDMGESDQERVVGNDAAVMPHVHCANIACGFHGGDPETIDKTLALAAAHGVAVGAHPSYPDREGFGRRSMALSGGALKAIIHYQVGALEAMAANHGLALTHVKPHGALYNDAMRDPTLRYHLFDAVASYRTALPLVLQATAHNAQLRTEATKAGVDIVFETFADRAYTDEGLLQPRDRPDAVLDTQAMLEQVDSLVRHGHIRSVGGKTLAIDAQTLCVHGDNPQGIAGIEALRTLLDENGSA